METINALLLLTPKKQLAYLDETMSIRQALEKMRIHGYMAIPVLSKKGEYIGSISEGDLLWTIVDEEMDEEYMEETYIIDIIRKDYIPAVKVDASVDKLKEMLMNQNYVPVIDDTDIFMGIVTRSRFLKALIDDE